MNEPGSSIAIQDELLELLYWFEGEGFRSEATLAGLVRFLTHEEAAVVEALARLTERGDVHLDTGTAQYRLTPTGRKEAARRFAAEFAPLLSQGHGECNDPNCDCHSDPKAAAECHARGAGGHTH